MSCPSVVDLNYGSFSEYIHTQASHQRIPLNGSFEVTTRCNVRCQHCYLPLAERAGSQQNELSFPEIQKILTEIADAGCLWLLLTGGEPFLRKDFLQIYDFAKQKGFIITIFTNGTLLTEQIVDHLAEWRPFAIEISLYGATQATYESVTGIPGSFDRCVKGIELLLARSLPLKLKSVLMTLNQHELEAMRQFSESRGLEFRFDPVINAGIDGSLDPIKFRLPPEEIITIESHDPARSENWPKSMAAAKDRDNNTHQLYTCGAGRKSFHIDASGKMSLCISSRNPQYDLRQGSFRDGWEYFLPKVLGIEYSETFACSTCALRTLCAQCPAMGLNELGNPEAKVPFLCQLAHLRQEAFEPLINL